MHTMRAAIILAAVCLQAASTFAFSKGLDGAVITSLEPWSNAHNGVVGSLAGGTLITIKGSGFQRGGIVGSTDVFIGALRCDVVDYYSDDTKLVCKTRQLHWTTTSNLQIKVALWSYTATSYAACAVPAGGARCVFTYDMNYATPIIETSSSTVVPGGKLEFGGYLRAHLATQFTVKIDGKLCEVHDIYEHHTSGGLTTDFTKHAGAQCVGSGADSLREHAGSADECMAQCIKLQPSGCVGFVRVNGAVGKCYFRTGTLSDPKAYDGDDRDCFVYNSEQAAGRKRRDSAHGRQKRMGEVEQALGYTIETLSADAFSATDGAADVTERVVATGTRDYAREWCTLPTDLEAGRYNYTVTVERGQPYAHNWQGELGFGDAQFREKGHSSRAGERDMARPSPGSDGEAYVLTVVPTIDAVSTAVSGSTGGDEVVVTGSGFHASATDCSANTIVLAGVECVVMAPCTAVQLVCIAANSTEAEVGPTFKGTAGLRAKVFTGVNNGRATDSSTWSKNSWYTSPSSEFVTIGGTDSLDIMSQSVMDSYSVEERGYFIPPATTDYRFWVYGDDVLDVFLDLDNLGFVNMTKVVGFVGATGSFFSDISKQISEPIRLEGGKRYPLKSQFSEGGGGDYWMLAVEQMNATRHEDMFQYQRVNEIQRVYLTAEATRQVELITLTGVTGGSLVLKGENKRVSDPIEITNIRNRQSQLRAAFDAVYRFGTENGNNCRAYQVDVVADAIATDASITFAVTINCRPRSDEYGNAIPFGHPVFDIAQLETTDGGVLHDDTAESAVEAVNFGFEDELPDEVGGYTKKSSLPGWSIAGSVSVVSNGNQAWGGLSSEKGEAFVAVQFSGSSVSQLLTGLDAGAEYSLRFLAANRPTGRTALMRVTMDGVEIMPATEPANWFSKHHTSFVASGSTATLTFEHVGGGGDRTFFLDDLHIAKALYLEGADAVVGLSVEMDVRPSNPLGGKFQFAMESHCAQVNCTVYGTPLINWNQDSGSTNAALKTLPNIKEVSTRQAYYIDADTGLETYWHEVQFLAPTGIDHPPLAAILDALTGDGVQTWTETRFNGEPDSVLHMPIPDYMLEVASTLPSATVQVNGINARCTDESSAGCQFVYDAEITGLVEEVSSDAGTSVTAGSTLTIRGQRLQHAGKGVTVTFGGSACAVTVHTVSEIQCTVAHSSYGVYYPKVTVHGTGDTTVAGGVAEMTYHYRIDAISPMSTGVRGGSVVTLSGTGFNVNDMVANDVRIGGAICKVRSATHSKVVCVAPALNNVDLSALEHNANLGTSPDVPLTIGFFDDFAFDEMFSYAWAETPFLKAMSPTFTSAARTATVTLTVEAGVGYDINNGVATMGDCTPSMTLVSPSGAVRNCEQLTVNDGGDVFTCVLVRAEPLPLAEQPLMFPRLQLCSSSGTVAVAHPAVLINTFDLALRVTSTTPSDGSIAGGTHVVISGAGFVDLSEKIVRSALTYNYYDVMTIVNIALPDRMVGCAISAASYNTIECITTMPESNAAVLTADAKHAFIDEGDGVGYNGKMAISVNDFPVPGCGSDPDAPADMRDGAWGAWNSSTEHAYAPPSATGRVPYVCEFDYAEAITPVIAGVEPPQGKGATALVISGSGLNIGGTPIVMVGATECVDVSATNTQIVCNLPAMTGGRYAIRVEVPSTGFAAHPADVDDVIEFVSQVEFSQTTPIESSLRGGVVVTIQGHGFSSTLANNKVFIGGQEAHLVFADHSQIVAVTPVSPSEPAPNSTSVDGVVQVVIEADAQTDYAYGQIRPVSRTNPKVHDLSCGSFGGQFELVFRQTAGVYLETSAWMEQNANDTNSDTFSVLNQLDAYRKVNGDFEFKLKWPEREGTNSQQWIQTTNPVTNSIVRGYKAVDVPFGTPSTWDGLSRSSSSSTLLDGTSLNSERRGDWWFAVGTSVEYNEIGMPGNSVDSSVEAVTELYACKEGEAVVANAAHVIDWNFDTTREQASITVEVGATVTWRFSLDEVIGGTHKFVSGKPGVPDGHFESRLLPQQGVWEYTFNQTGDFHYYSDPLAFLQGTVSVRDHVLEAPAAYRLRSDLHCAGPGGCTINYTTRSTPIISAIEPMSGQEGERLTITGTSLVSDDGSPTEVLIGAIACEVDHATATSVECVVGAVPGGLHTVFLTVGGQGTARSNGGLDIHPDKVNRTFSSCCWDPTFEDASMSAVRGWLAPRGYKPGEWLQLELDRVTLIAGLTTAGRQDAPQQRVTVYQVVTSRDGIEWTNLGNFVGNVDYDSTVTNRFDRAVYAKYVRIVVVAWNEHPVLRASLVLPTLSFESTMTVASVSVAAGSYGGGTTLVLTGAGFGSPDASANTGDRARRDGAWGGWVIYDGAHDNHGPKELGSKIQLCDTDCIVTESSYNEITCVTSPLHSIDAMMTYDHIDRGLLSGASAFSSNSEDHVLKNLVASSELAFDRDFVDKFEQNGNWWSLDLIKSSAVYNSGGMKAPNVYLNHGSGGMFSATKTLPRLSTWRLTTSLRTSGHRCADPLENWIITINGEQVGKYYNYPLSTNHHVSYTFTGDSMNVQMVVATAQVARHCHARVEAFTLEDVGIEPRTPACFVGMDLGDGEKAVISRFRFFPPHQEASLTDGGYFQTSANKEDWKTLAVVSDPHQGWNWVDANVTDQSPARYIRYVGPWGGRCEMTELEFYGFQAADTNTCTVEVATTNPRSHPSLGPMLTDHRVVMNVKSEHSFSYEHDKTGVVTSVEPRFGSSLGGDLITVIGRNLATTVDDAKVMLNGKECAVQTVAVNGTAIECITSARGKLNEMNPLSLIVSDAANSMGDAISMQTVRYRYLDKWSAVNTWLNDEPPVAGDSVIIPEDQTILMDVSPPRLNWLQVNGMLVFDRKDLNLDATYILVYGGTLEVGTEAEPFLQQATITLHGDRRETVELPFVGSKVLAVADKGGFTTHGKGRGVDVPLSQKGILDIHGIPRMRTWTKVGATVAAGTKTITTIEPTDFAMGEKVVLTAPHQELTVATRIDNYTFTVVEIITNTHVSETREHPGFDTMDMTCEVALLSRNIVIQGAGLPRLDGTPTIEEGDDEVPSAEQLFGVHTGAFHGGHYRVENTELRHCGQAGNLGRYCMHFHVNDDNPAPNSYIKSNSIHHSFQRATTVHGTHHALVQNNVAYHVMGHTYFVEDGDETFNTFDGNIGIFTKPSHMMLKSDKQPSTFWTAIPTNYWRNNIATDCTDRGAWFELENQGITLEFHNNTFHNNGGIGFRNYPNYSPPSPQYFTNNTYYKNGGNGLFYKKGGDNHHVHSKFAENGVDLFWTKYSTHDDSRLIPNVKDCLFYGGRGAQAIFAPQNEYWYVDGATFVNYEDTGAISGCAGCCTPQKFRQGAYTYRFENLKWVNTSARTRWTCPYKQIFYDLDGSLTGYSGGTALPYYQFNDWEGECEMDGTGTFDKGHRGMVCNDKVRVRRLQLEGNEPRELDNKRIFFKKSQMVPPIANTVVDRFGHSDKFGAVDWQQYDESGNLFEGCLDSAQEPLKGFCMWAGKDQNTDVQKYQLQEEESKLDEPDCLAWCRTVDGSTGCELIIGAANEGCYAHKGPIDQASGSSDHLCWLFPQTGVTDSGLRKTPLHFSGCVGLDGLDFINYRQAGTATGEFDGWAIPMVTHHDYYGDLDWHIDWQRLKMRWSEPFYFQEPYNKPLTIESGSQESALLRWPYVDYRYRFRTAYAGIQGNEKNWWDHTIPDGETEMYQLTRFDDFGASQMVRQDDTLRTTGSGGEWKVSMNPWSGIEVEKNLNAYKVDIEALQCAPSMCGLPGDNQECMQADGKTWDTNKCKPLRWSQKATWTALKSKQLNTVSIEHTGLTPEDGDSVEIPQNTMVILDVDDCPKLDLLVVTGRLVVEAGSAAKVRRLEANRMLVWGELEAGTEAAPYTAGEFEIKLHGVRTSDTFVVVEHHFLGNKNLVIFGDVHLHGNPDTAGWTGLTTTADPGATEITVDDASRWAVGDTIVITGTEYPAAFGFEDLHKQAFLEDYVPHQSEVRSVTSVVGHTITFDEPLANRHFADVVDAGNGVNVTLQAHVGLLSHNVRVTGDLTDSPVEDEVNWYTGYGGHIVVGEANYGNYTKEELLELQEAGENLGIVRKLGSFVASNVQFQDLGKLASEHPALQYRYFSDLSDQPELIPRNHIKGCSFVDSWNYVVAMERSMDVVLEGNVMHRNFNSAIDVDLASTGTVLMNNLVSSVHRPVDAYTPSCKKDSSCWNFPFAAFSVWNKDKDLVVRGNVVAGSEDIGYMLYPVDSCEAAGGVTYTVGQIDGNEAYGTLVGQYVLADGAQDECRAIKSFKAWKNAHLGIVTVDQTANIKVVDAVLADNHEGISLNFVKTGWEAFSSVEDSVIMGSTAASVDGASSACRAVNIADTRGLTCNSEFGTAWRRVGIVMPQYTNLPKTCEQGKVGGVCRPPNKVHRMCSLPWENRFGNLNVQHATMEITNVTFAHWKSADDGAISRAIALNPSQPDFAPRTTLSGISWDTASVDATARFQLGDASYQTNEAKACNGVMGSCDAVNYFTLVDADGSTMAAFWDDGADVRGESFTILSAFNPAIARADKCISDASTQSIVCRDYNMIRLVLESDPPRFTKRRLGPATITKYSDTPKYESADNRTSFSVGPFPQSCSCQKHFAQFTMEVEAGLEYDLFTTAVLQDKNRISFNSPNASDCIVAKVAFSKPNAIEVFVATRNGGRGDLIPRAEEGLYPTATDVSGTNLHHPQERMLYVTLCGGDNNSFWMDYTSKIQVTATLDMSVDEFFATEDPNSRTTGLDSFVTNVALLLGIPHSQIKVACVHKVGQPCIPLRRARRATDESEGGIEVEFEILAPETTMTDEGEEVGFGTDETREYLTNLMSEFEELIDTGVLADQLETAGFAGLSVDVTYDDAVTTTTTTTTTITTITTIANATTDSTNSTEQDTTAEEATSTNTGAVVGGVLAGFFVIASVVAFVVYRNKGDLPKQMSGIVVEEQPSATELTTRQDPTVTLEDAAPKESRSSETVFPSQDEPSFFSRQTRAEVQQDSLFDAAP